MTIEDADIQVLNALKTFPYIEQVEIIRSLTVKYPDFLDPGKLSQYANLLKSESERLFRIRDNIDISFARELSTISHLATEPEQIDLLEYARQTYPEITISDLGELCDISKSAVSKLLAVNLPENRSYLPILRPTKNRHAIANILASFKKLSRSTQNVFFEYAAQKQILLTEQSLIKAYNFEQLGGTLTIENLECEIFDSTLKHLTDSLEKKRKDDFELYKKELEKINHSLGDLEIQYELNDFLTSPQAIRDWIANGSYQNDGYSPELELLDEELMIPEGELSFKTSKNSHRMRISRKVSRSLIEKITGEKNVEPHLVIYKLFSALKTLE